MAIARKTEVMQVRCRPEDLAAFKDACKLRGIKPTECIRRLMGEYAETMQKRAVANAKWEALKASRAAAATSVPVAPEKAPVEPVNVPMKLSERRKAEKAAKKAKMAKRADKF